MPGSLRLSKAFASVAVWVVLAVGSPSLAADLRDVRVGLNKDYTRVVLETDSKAAFTLSETSDAVTLQVQASARPQAVAAKGPHLAWVRVEPAGDGATVKLELRRPARVKQMVLTGPNRIVIDVYADDSAAAAPVAAAKPKPRPEPAPVVVPPREPEPAAIPAPAVAEATPPTQPPRADDEAALLAEAEAMLGPAATPAGDEIAANEGAASEPAAASLDGVDEAVAPVAEATPPLPPLRNATKSSGDGILDSIANPYVLGVLAVVMIGVVVILRKRKPAAAAARSESPADDEVSLFPSEIAAPGMTGNLAQTEVIVPPPAGEDVGSAFDFEAPSPAEPEKPGLEPVHGAVLSTIGTLTSTTAFEPPTPRAAGGLSLAELERRLALLETRLEEVIDAKDRLERQVSAQTEELRVQRAAIARTQRVLRTVVRPDDEPSEPILKT